MSSDFRATLPSEFVENVLGVCGPRGDAWLRDLPQRISELESKWKLKVGPHFNDLSYNFVAPADRADGLQLVLKLGLPADDGEYFGEVAYLRLLSGDGAVRLIDENRAARALLLQRAIPGDNLRIAFGRSHHKVVEAAIRILNGVIRKPPANKSDFIPLEQWTQKLNDPENKEFPANYIQKAIEIFDGTNGTQYRLLHGDFHHENILSNGSETFLVIDPKGLIGDPRYDIAVFLNNHRDWLRSEPQLRSALGHAVNRFADEFGFSSSSIREWAFAQKVLGAYWTCAEGHSWREQLASADIWDV